MATRKRYSKQFKLHAVELLAPSDKPASGVARERGVMRHRLYKWQYALPENGEDKAFRGPGRNAATDQRSEVADVKKRLAPLEEEHAMLKKAAAYFAQELP